MNKIFTILVLSLLLIGVQTGFAADKAAVQKQDAASSFDAAVKEYNFEDNSYNISDEQVVPESGEESLQKDKKASFWSKIINSSHFSSNTATKTWIPINKVQ